MMTASVFSHAAFWYVDIVIGAIVAAAILWFSLTALCEALECQSGDLPRWEPKEAAMAIGDDD